MSVTEYSADLKTLCTCNTADCSPYTVSQTASPSLGTSCFVNGLGEGKNVIARRGDGGLPKNHSRKLHPPLVKMGYPPAGDGD